MKGRERGVREMGRGCGWQGLQVSRIQVIFIQVFRAITGSFYCFSPHCYYHHYETTLPYNENLIS